MSAGGERPTFYYDLGSPWSYLVAERAHSVLGEVPVWQPVLAAALSASAQSEQLDRARVERGAAERGLPPIRWPTPWPPDSRTAMLAATFALGAGRVVAFSLAAFRQAFAAGRDLGRLDNVLIAAAACELHPRALTRAVEGRAATNRLEAATRAAAEGGVVSVPAIVAAGRTYLGERSPEEAAAGVR